MARSDRSDIVNRKLMDQTRRVLAALPPKEREALYYAGIGPGYGYIGMWKIVNSMRHSLVSIVANLAHDDLAPEVRSELEKQKRYYTEQIIGCYATVMPYEMAKLQAMTLSGDPDHPLQVEHDFSGLSYAELEFLARILPKLGGATEATEGDATQDVPGPGLRGNEKAPGAAGARSDRKGLRKAKKAADR